MYFTCARSLRTGAAEISSLARVLPLPLAHFARRDCTAVASGLRYRLPFLICLVSRSRCIRATNQSSPVHALGTQTACRHCSVHISNSRSYSIYIAPMLRGACAQLRRNARGLAARGDPSPSPRPLRLSESATRPSPTRKTRPCGATGTPSPSTCPSTRRTSGAPRRASRSWRRRTTRPRRRAAAAPRGGRAAERRVDGRRRFRALRRPVTDTPRRCGSPVRLPAVAVLAPRKSCSVRRRGTTWPCSSVPTFASFRGFGARWPRAYCDVSDRSAPHRRLYSKRLNAAVGTTWADEALAQRVPGAHEAAEVRALGLEGEGLQGPILAAQ